MLFNIKQSVISSEDAAYPTVVRLANNDLICGYSVGGGPNISGGTHWSRSTDNGCTWMYEGIILPGQEKPRTANSLRLSGTASGAILAYGQRKYIENETKFGRCRNEAVFCVADPECREWSTPTIIPNTFGCPVEISNPIVELRDGRWLAPAALLPHPERLGEKVIVWESLNRGMSWEKHRTVMAAPAGKEGFFEQKLLETAPGKLFAFAWTVELGSYRTLPNTFSVSEDGGRSWNGPFATDITVQTMTPFWLGGDSFLLIYRADAGIKLSIAEIRGDRCRSCEIGFIWQPAAAANALKQGIDQLEEIAVGLPSLIRLDHSRFMAFFWAKDAGTCKVVSTAFELNGAAYHPYCSRLEN